MSMAIAGLRSHRRVAAVTGGTGGISGGISLALTNSEFDMVASDRMMDQGIAASVARKAAPGTRLSLLKAIRLIGKHESGSLICSGLTAVSIEGDQNGWPYGP
jgi:hypothetical protein